MRVVPFIYAGAPFLGPGMPGLPPQGHWLCALASPLQDRVDGAPALRALRGRIAFGIRSGIALYSLDD